MNDKVPKKIKIVAKEHGNRDAKIYIDGKKIDTIEKVSMNMSPPHDDKHMFPTIDIKRVLTPEMLKQQGSLEKGFREMCEVEITFEKALVKFQENVVS